MTAESSWFCHIRHIEFEIWSAKSHHLHADARVGSHAQQNADWLKHREECKRNCDQTLQSIVINHISIGIENDLYIHERISGVKMNPSPCLVQVSRVKRRLRPRVRLMHQRPTYTTRNRTIKNPKATALATAKLKLELGPNLKLEFVKLETWTAKLNLSPWLTIGEVLARYSFAKPQSQFEKWKVKKHTTILASVSKTVLGGSFLVRKCLKTYKVLSLQSSKQLQSQNRN